MIALEYITEGFVIGLTITITLLLGYITYREIKRYLESFYKKSIDATIEKVSKIYDILSSILSECPASRVLVLKAHNGGGIPVPGKPLYSTVMYALSKPPAKPMRNKWNKVYLDKFYINLIQHIIDNKVVKLYTEDMPESILKNVYRSSGFKQSAVYFLSKTKEELYYLSVVFDDDFEYDSSYSDMVRIKTQEISELLS